MPSTTLLDIPPAEQAQMRATYTVARDMALCWPVLTGCVQYHASQRA